MSETLEERAARWCGLWKVPGGTRDEFTVPNIEEVARGNLLVNFRDVYAEGELRGAERMRERAAMLATEVRMLSLVPLIRALPPGA